MARRSEHASLQRIYGTAWATEEQLAAYLHLLEEAEKRDHRRLGREMDLFHLQEEAPGSVFWHPKGWTLFQSLIAICGRRQEANGYVEVNAPDMMDDKLLGAVRPLGQVRREHVRHARRPTSACSAANR